MRVLVTTIWKELSSGKITEHSVSVYFNRKDSKQEFFDMLKYSSQQTSFNPVEIREQDDSINFRYAEVAMDRNKDYMLSLIHI